MNDISTATTYIGGGGFNGAIADVVRQPEIAMTGYKQEVVITRERHDISARFQRILDICNYAQHAETLDNIVLCRRTPDRQTEIAMAAS